ncbi:MAG: tetratricopeptide repeat protein [Richelia sp. RM2_1_2]|nr:tetratricopeptide repeat protein [Richelia sp. RM2_1_2]
MKSKLTLYTSILSSLLLLQNPTFAAKSPHLVSQIATKIPNCAIEPEEEEGEYSPQQLQTLASRITMRVIGNNNGGSGTIIGKRGNKYLIVTNSHVIQGVNSIQVQAFDGKNYPAQVVPNNNFEKFDLALLEFQTSQNYCLPDIADFIPNPEMEVLAAGFSSEKGKIMFRKGKIDLISQSPLKGGYSIGYTNDIDQGMSGGAIINTQGTLIGINGKSAYPILNTGYAYQDGSKPNQEEIQQFRKLSWGVPIRTFLVEVNPEILTAYKLPYPKTISANVPEGEYTGWLGDLEQKAKQFTVRIDSSSQANGSGTIIAKEGNIYTVLTTAHVVCESENRIPPCPKNSYKILAPDGNEYPVDKSSIKIESGIDLAVVKFNSSQDYQVATLANYNHNFVDLVFAAGYPKLKNNSPWRFSPGMIFDKEFGLIFSKESDFLLPGIGSSGSKSIYSLTGGYKLVYTSITYGGMSGGPVLDSLGRVIGIHGRAEGEEVRDSSINDGKIQIGYSLGIPVSTFIGLLSRLNVTPQKLENNTPPQLNPKQFKSFGKAILSTKVSTGNATASEWLERGNQLLRLHRFDEAIKAFDEVIRQKPSFAYLAYYAKGIALSRKGKGKYKESIAAYKQALEIKPEFVVAWRYLSTTYSSSGQHNKALDAINEAIKLQPTNPNGYLTKGSILFIEKRYAEAEKIMTEAIKLSPSNVSYIARGRIYASQTKWNLAKADLDTAIKLNPQSVYAYNVRGLFYYDQNKFELALADYNKAIQNKAIQIYSGMNILYINRGNVYRELKKWDLAIADYSKVIELDPKYASAYNKRGNIYYHQEKWDLALADYSKAIEINPENAIAYINRGNIYLQQKKWDLALADLNKAIKINPKYTIAYNSRGNIYHSQKNGISTC